MGCNCKKLKNAIKEGVVNMEKEKAPYFVIEDYIEDMTNGDWVGCSDCQDKQIEKE